MTEIAERIDDALAEQGHTRQALEQWLPKLQAERFAGHQLTYAGNQACPFWRRVQAQDEDGQPLTNDYGLPIMADAMHGCLGGVDYEVWHTASPQRRFKFCALNSALIWHHHFYEGAVPHRVDPDKLLQFLSN